MSDGSTRSISGALSEFESSSASRQRRLDLVTDALTSLGGALHTPLDVGLNDNDMPDLIPPPECESDSEVIIPDADVTWFEPLDTDSMQNPTTELDFGVFDGSPPVVSIPSPPNENMGVLPSAPGISGINVPAAPNIAFPPPPNLLSLSIRVFDGATIPEFTQAAPGELSLTEPTVVDYTPGPMYASSLLTELRDSLEQRIATGGTGLSADVEQAIWDRARERELRTLQDAIDDLERMETMGYAFPPGVWVDARLKVRTEFGKTEAGLSRDIAIEQAKLELENIKDALGKAIAVESKLIDALNEVEQRVFERAKYITQANVEVYNARVRAYLGRVEAYKAQVQAYEARVRAEMIKVEVYKAEIEAEKAKADINKVLADVYRVQIDAALSAIEVYRARIEGVKAQAEVDRTRVMAYEAQVRAYAVGAEIFRARVEAYKAQIDAQRLNVEIYRAQVEAYKARAEAAAAMARARAAETEARAAIISAQANAQAAAANARSAAIQAGAAVATANAAVTRANAEAQAAYNTAAAKMYEANGVVAAAQAQAQFVSQQAATAMTMQGTQIAMAAAQAGLQAMAQIGAAAANQFSESFTESKSQSKVESESTNRNFNYNFGG
jgi:hypothetical protein